MRTKPEMTQKQGRLFKSKSPDAIVDFKAGKKHFNYFYYRHLYYYINYY